MYDIAIIGAGITGGMLARTLAAYDLKICILEKENDVAMGATRANSGIVHAGYDAEEGSLKAKLNVRGSEMMETVARELGVPYRNNGSMVIGFNEDDRKVVEQLYRRGIKNGVKNLRILTGEEARRLEPNLSEDVVCALYAPSCAIICPYELAIAAVGNAMDNGAELLLNFEVQGIEKKEEYYEIVSGTREPECPRKVQARYVVNAAGVYSDEIAKLAGDHTIQIHPRRGEYLLLDKTCGSLVSHTIFRTPSPKGKGILITPTVDGNLLLGPTSVDREDKEDTATTAEGIARIMEQAGENVRNIPFQKVITSFSGLRAAGNTGDFIITSHRPGFINAAGIESPGLTAAPAIAEYITDMLKDQGLKMEARADYQPIRKPVYAFREASVEEKNEMIRKDKAYGRVVCRCETVTEGEILAAIHTNPPARDLDGIKRRTRAQMGRCQGGFCMPHIAELLARELGIPCETVTKSGPGSEISMGRTKESRES
ncbi:MAG: NAD(P)/FAD-dependent oxidoreductase [Lachnospiraceae bacterium]|jgi:glycerol-3-phosphate dehydrogenase|nr:NAD(P)/FAD-dependent oxidoreductase [Lachnospiraceae bacterium]